jgi:CubicO group peptidase (beta-lactamase class C family)
MNQKWPPLRVVSTCLSVALVAGCAGATSTLVPVSTPMSSAVTPIPMPESASYWPTEGWRTSTPEQQGMDSDLLAQMLQAIEDRGLNIHSVLVVRNGYIVTEAYYSSFHQDTKHGLWSVTKSLVSALVGIAIDKGYIDGVDQPAVDCFPDLADAGGDARRRTMTLEHLLTMTSGLDWSDDKDIPTMAQGRDWPRYVLGRPMVEEPGIRFNYNSGNTHVLSAIIQDASGMDTLDFARKYLFDPLGISDVEWETDPSGIPIGGWGLQLRPRDLAKLGYLYLNEGAWDGQQIIPADWVRESTQKRVRVEEHLEPWDLHYGYGWWLHEFGAYAAHGRGGQFIFVIPDLDVVVVFTSWLPESEFVQPELLIRDFIVPAVISPTSAAMPIAAPTGEYTSTFAEDAAPPEPCVCAPFV